MNALPTIKPSLNDRAATLCRGLGHAAVRLRLDLHRRESGALVVDCGVDAAGGIEAGLLLAQICLADMATVRCTSGDDVPGPAIEVHTDQPVLACLASQYAGWEIKGEKFFAMASGPMRAAAAREPLFAELGYREAASQCVGVLESGRLPADEICLEIAAKCGVPANKLTLLAAPTRSLAGTVQVVARSVETALHKLHELKFDVSRVQSAWGIAPLPPPAKDDLGSIGRTNDAILYGAHAVLYLRGDDASLESIGPQTPSSASRDYGRPFAETMAAYDNDFYKIDPLLFSPAMVTLVNLDSGRSFRYGEINHKMLEKSFGAEGPGEKLK